MIIYIVHDANISIYFYIASDINYFFRFVLLACYFIKKRIFVINMIFTL